MCVCNLKSKGPFPQKIQFFFSIGHKSSLTYLHCEGQGLFVLLYCGQSVTGFHCKKTDTKMADAYWLFMYPIRCST